MNMTFNRALKLAGAMAAAATLTTLTSLTSGCARQIHDMRESRLANGTQAEAFEVHESVRSTLVKVDASGHLHAPSGRALNAMLQAQGRLKNQTLLLIPNTVAGAQSAHFIARKLIANGAREDQVQILASTDADTNSADLQVISRALVVDVPDCSNDTATWTDNPYAAYNNLGCANRANLARMVSNPADLARPQVLAPADGVQSQEAITRYRDNDLTELLDIDFSDD